MQTYKATYSQDPATNGNLTNALSFAIREMLKDVNTCEPVQVVSVNEQEETCTVIPLILQYADQNILLQQNTPIQDLPYIKYQAGLAQIKMVPVVGDVGLVIYCQRDITSAKEVKGVMQTPPLTAAMFNKGDGIYIGSISGLGEVEPTMIVEFQQEAQTIKITSPNVVIDSNVSITKGLTVGGDCAIAGGAEVAGVLVAADLESSSLQGVPYSTHIHPVPDGVSGAPTA